MPYSHKIFSNNSLQSHSLVLLLICIFYITIWDAGLHWLIDWLSDWLIDWLISWSNYSSIDWLIDWLIGFHLCCWLRVTLRFCILPRNFLEKLFANSVLVAQHRNIIPPFWPTSIYEVILEFSPECCPTFLDHCAQQQKQSREIWLGMSLYEYVVQSVEIKHGNENQKSWRTSK